jgi:hypothetical protein
MLRGLIAVVGRMFAVFAVIWVLCFVGTHYGCAQAGGNEMSPALEKDSVKVMRLRGDAGGFSPDAVVFYFVGSDAQKNKHAGRIRAVPGGKFDVPYRLWPGVQEAPEEALSVHVPRDHFLVLWDNRQAAPVEDSRTLGPIGLYAIRGSLMGGK